MTALVRVNELERYVKQQLQRAGEERITSFEVRHVHEGGSKRIDSFTIPAKFDSFDELLGAAVADIGKCAQDDADAKGGRQRYAIRAKNAGGIVAERQFNLTGADEEQEAGSYLTEEPNTRGALALSMRYQQGFMSEALTSAKDARQDLKEDLAAARARIKELEADEGKVRKLYNELLNENHKRAMEIRAADKKEARRERMLEGGKRLLPALAGQIPGLEKILGKMGSEDILSDVFSELASDDGKLDMTLEALKMLPIEPKKRAKLIGFFGEVIQRAAAQKKADDKKKKDEAGADTAH